MAIVGSNIEVYSCLNPLYYSIERKFEKMKRVCKHLNEIMVYSRI